MISFKKSTFLCLLSFVIAIVVFLKNAWVAEDAYILFRSIEQLFAGNGPIWNPHERVQAFTSPLWFYILALIRIFSNNVYLNAISVSLILWIVTIVVLKRIFKRNLILLTSILLFSASTGFYDYTSSGLENVLAYFILAVYVLNYTNLFSLYEGNSLKNMSKEYYIKYILISFGLIICVRHDLSLLLLPSTIYVVLKNSRIFSIKKWIIFSLIILSPFILYSLFSLFYYGFPFPNTAYAKLNTGICKIDLLEQGMKYFISSLKYDTATLLVIAFSLGLSFFASAEEYPKYLSCGVLLNLLYVCYVGGDFMQGRFLSYAYMVSVVLLLLQFDKIRSYSFQMLVFIAICFYLVLYPHTPFNSPLTYNKGRIDMGIDDERGWYFEDLSLYRYFIHDKKDKFFPARKQAKDGYEFKKAPDKIIIINNVGIFGYFAGNNKIIIDHYALTDPLLARMPVSGKWRIGHFPRNIPEGYVESIINGSESIVNPNLNEFYRKLKIITQNEDLFTKERLKTILLFNIGFYNHLLLDK